MHKLINYELLWDNLKDNHYIYCLLSHPKIMWHYIDWLWDTTNVVALIWFKFCPKIFDILTSQYVFLIFNTHFSFANTSPSLSLFLSIYLLVFFAPHLFRSSLIFVFKPKSLNILGWREYYYCISYSFLFLIEIKLLVCNIFSILSLPTFI